jgi:hypothetical protein
MPGTEPNTPTGRDTAQTLRPRTPSPQRGRRTPAQPRRGPSPSQPGEHHAPCNHRDARPFTTRGHHGARNRADARPPRNQASTTLPATTGTPVPSRPADTTGRATAQTPVHQAPRPTPRSLQPPGRPSPQDPPTPRTLRNHADTTPRATTRMPDSLTTQAGPRSVRTTGTPPICRNPAIPLPRGHHDPRNPRTPDSVASCRVVYGRLLGNRADTRLHRGPRKSAPLATPRHQDRSARRRQQDTIAARESPVPDPPPGQRRSVATSPAPLSPRRLPLRGPSPPGAYPVAPMRHTTSIQAYPVPSREAPSERRFPPHPNRRRMRLPVVPGLVGIIVRDSRRISIRYRHCRRNGDGPPRRAFVMSRYAQAGSGQAGNSPVFRRLGAAGSSTVPLLADVSSSSSYSPAGRIRARRPAGSARRSGS